MARGSAAVGVGVALTLAVAFGGCVSTSMSAAELRVPVLFGPVPCIGCTAGRRLPGPAPSARITGRGRFYTFFLPFFLWGLGVGDDSQLSIPPDRLLYWTPCRDDLQLSSLRARAWQVTVPLLIYLSDVSVEADAQEIAVPGATCRAP